MKTVLINKEPVELYKILKFEGLVNSGADAKLFIDDKQVKVNDIVETRRRRKIKSGDTITFNGVKLLINLLDR